MDKVLAPLGVRPAGVFLDLGISSPQFDDQGRGFRPEQDGPLDLRFDLTKGVPAYEFLKTVDRDELMRIVGEYGETSDPSAARRVADAVVVARESASLPSTTKAFASLVAAAKGKEYQAMHPAKLTFQALRIHLNQEFDEMRRGMRAAMEILRDGGALGVLTVRLFIFVSVPGFFFSPARVMLHHVVNPANTHSRANSDPPNT
jgi:16S rRNA (cytosine1402-N4)-methyltransferase